MNEKELLEYCERQLRNHDKEVKRLKGQLVRHLQEVAKQNPNTPDSVKRILFNDKTNDIDWAYTLPCATLEDLSNLIEENQS